MRWVLILSICTIILFPSMSLAQNPAEESTLRCPGGLVQTGLSTLKVLNLCGKPNMIPVPVTPLSSDLVSTVWLYNMGDGQFIYRLMFRYGVLEEITRLERGFGLLEFQ